MVCKTSVRPHRRPKQPKKNQQNSTTQLRNVHTPNGILLNVTLVAIVVSIAIDPEPLFLAWVVTNAGWTRCPRICRNTGGVPSDWRLLVFGRVADDNDDETNK